MELAGAASLCSRWNFSIFDGAAAPCRLLAAAAAAALICTALTGSPRGIETALILGCGTLQMLVLYIFGLYFAHAYKEIKARPVYIVRERG